ncbi:MAG: MFS transporter, partial [Nocardioides sp.]|nr:MFS transporter [Nocardioides sp.]
GFLADKTGPGKEVLAGISTVTVGMAMFTQITAETSYAYMIGSLFVMGLGMGSTMMPIMSSALATLTDHNIARGSTLMNITQQVAASIGTALFSVILTNELKGKESVQLAGALESGDDARVATILERLGVNSQSIDGVLARVPGDMADAFALTFVVGTVLVACCLVPAYFLPRRPAEQPVDPAAMVGH